MDDRAPRPRRRGPAIGPPGDTWPLIGRDDDAAALRDLIDDTSIRLITVTGLAGVGKSCLVASVLAQLPVTARWIDAATCRTADDLTAAIDNMMEADLLVLDDVDGPAGQAATIGRFIDTHAGPRLIVTSWRPLRLRAEVEYRLAPLTVPAGNEPLDDLLRQPAVRMFVGGAHDVQHRFRLTAENAGAVVAICRRLGGLPLGIVLASGRMRSVSPATLLDLLAADSGDLGVLGEGFRDVPGRQRTMASAIDSMVGRLTTTEQQVFRQLAVFEGGWTFDTARLVCDMPQAANLLDVLRTLVDTQLIDLDPATGRYQMLDILRGFGLAALIAAGEAEAVRLRHARTFAGFVSRVQPQFNTPARVQAIRAIDAEYGNIRAAFAWSSLHPETATICLQLTTGLWRFWCFHGWFDEGLGWLTSALTIAGEPSGDAADLALRTDAVYAMGVLARLEGRVHEAQQRFERTVVLRRLAGDRAGEAYALVNFDGTTNRSDPLQDILAGVAIFRTIDDPFGLAFALQRLGSVALQHQDLVLAGTALAESLAIFKRIDDWWGIALVQRSLGMLAVERGDLPAARLAFEDSIERLREVNDQWAIGDTLRLLADVARRRHDDASAARLAEERRSLLNGSGGDVAQRVSGMLTAVRALLQPPARTPLSRRELDVLRLVAQGKSNPEIARDLYLSPHTVARHISHILTRLNLANRVEAAMYAAQQGLLSG